MPREDRLFLSVLLVSVWLITSCSSVDGSDSHYWSNPETIIDKINKQGASQVVQTLWANDTAWNSVTMAISSGTADWVSVAVALRRGSDAGASNELRDAMFQALGKNPDEVLQQAEPEYPLVLLCEGRADPLPSYQEALAELKQTRVAVEKVQNTELQREKARCLTKLKEAEEQMGHFFGKEACKNGVRLDLFAHLRGFIQ